jgi:hypothetical protein
MGATREARAVRVDARQWGIDRRFDADIESA